MLQADDDTAEDRKRWMQQGVSQRSVREPSDINCVTQLPDAVGGASYVPPPGFDCEPVQGPTAALLLCPYPLDRLAQHDL